MKAANTPKNQRPIANAGFDRLVGLAQSISLDASQSYDPDGALQTYRWRQTKGTKVVLVGADTATPTFVTPTTLKKSKPIDLVFKLTVTDNNKGRATDTVKVNVSDRLWAGCDLPWGSSIQNGVTAVAYQSASVAFGKSCVSEVRNCTNGVLSGSYQNVTCTVAPADGDGDGMLDILEAAHGLNPTLNDAALDLDGDFVSNLQEFKDGTDPSDKNSYLPNSVSCPATLTFQNDTCVSLPALATGKLNDTGITTCGNDYNKSLPCPIADFPGQDGQYGRDVTHNDDSDGHAGFSFTKISSAGQPLPADATAWDCVKDNVTGLMWEVKTADGGLRDQDHTYTWYEPDNSKNGGAAGTQNGGSCLGAPCDNTLGYVQAVNAQGLCGASDWRMPTRQELFGIVSLDRSNPAIDMGYFPNTRSAFYWSASTCAGGGGSAVLVDFDDGSYTPRGQVCGISKS